MLNAKTLLCVAACAGLSAGNVLAANVVYDVYMGQPAAIVSGISMGEVSEAMNTKLPEGVSAYRHATPNPLNKEKLSFTNKPVVMLFSKEQAALLEALQEVFPEAIIEIAQK